MHTIEQYTMTLKSGEIRVFDNREDTFDAIDSLGLSVASPDEFAWVWALFDKQIAYAGKLERKMIRG